MQCSFVCYKYARKRDRKKKTSRCGRRGESGGGVEAKAKARGNMGAKARAEAEAEARELRAK
jgi:hypothetical protein